MYKKLMILFMFAIVSTDLFALPSIQITGKNKPGYSMVDGYIKEIIKTKQMYDIVINTKLKYWDKYGEKLFEYDLIFCNFAEATVKKGDLIKEGSLLGTTSEISCITARSLDLNPFVVRSLREDPQRDEDYWYYQPIWIMSNYRHTMQYKPIASIDEKIKQYIQRIITFGEYSEKGFVVDFKENEDHIAFSIGLPTIPTLTTNMHFITVINNVTGNKYNDFTLDSYLLTSNDTKLILFWRDRFDKYLEEEYDSKYSINLYGDIIAYNRESNTVFIFIDDFQILTDAQVIENNYDIRRFRLYGGKRLKMLDLRHE